jgi:glycosyltransferase involved in cell wall biosynthesis
MKISIVTPSFQRATYLDDTIESVLSQKGDFSIEYIIQDGGSGADVLEILDKWDKKIKQGKFIPKCNNIQFRYFIEKDRGMYDAINKGFSKTSGDVIAWINTDDMYHPFAFNTVVQVFKKFPDVHWITGIPNSYNHYGSRSGWDQFPAAYSREFLARGYYDVKFLEYGFNWVQQESTFWRRTLWEKAGGKVNCQYKYAADFFLWQEFAKHTDLVKIHSFLGGYRFHGLQATASPEAYRKELPGINPPPKGIKVLRKILRNFPYTRKLFFNERRGGPFIRLLGLRWKWLIGRTIVWSFQTSDWEIQHRKII